MLIDDGLLTRNDGHWVAAGDLTRITVPPTIHALLSARLDRLGRDERAVIERGSVEGKVFHRGAVARALDRDLARVGAGPPAGPRPQGADPARPDGSARRGRLPLPSPADPRRRLRGDAEGASSRASRAIRRAGSSRSAPSTSPSATRSSVTTLSRPTGTARSSLRSTTRRGSSPSAREKGSLQPPARRCAAPMSRRRSGSPNVRSPSFRTGIRYEAGFSPSSVTPIVSSAISRRHRTPSKEASSPRQRPAIAQQLR